MGGRCRRLLSAIGTNKSHSGRSEERRQEINSHYVTHLLPQDVSNNCCDSGSQILVGVTPSRVILKLNCLYVVVFSSLNQARPQTWGGEFLPQLLGTNQGPVNINLVVIFSMGSNICTIISKTRKMRSDSDCLSNKHK